MNPSKLLFFSPLFFLLACGSGGESESDNSTDSSHVQTEQTDTYLVMDEITYASDWLTIRDAILDGDEETLTPYIDTDEVDAPELIEICSEEWVSEKLFELTYEALGETDMNGDLVKEFSAETVYDYEGEEYGSSLSMYFKETANGLRLTGFFIAG